MLLHFCTVQKVACEDQFGFGPIVKLAFSIEFLQLILIAVSCKSRVNTAVFRRMEFLILLDL